MISRFGFRTNLKDNQTTIYLPTNLTHLHAAHNPLAKDDRGVRFWYGTPCCDYLHVESPPYPLRTEFESERKVRVMFVVRMKLAPDEHKCPCVVLRRV